MRILKGVQVFLVSMCLSLSALAVDTHSRDTAQQPTAQIEHIAPIADVMQWMAVNIGAQDEAVLKAYSEKKEGSTDSGIWSEIAADVGIAQENAQSKVEWAYDQISSLKVYPNQPGVILPLAAAGLAFAFLLKDAFAKRANKASHKPNGSNKSSFTLTRLPFV